MFLTAQRVISDSGENAINGFLYMHDVAWETPPEPIAGSIGDLVHSLILVTPGNNKVVSYLDIVAPDHAPYARVRELLLPWLETHAGQAMPWTGIVENVRFGLHMTATYARAWRWEVAKLTAACQMTLDGYTLPASPEKPLP